MRRFTELDREEVRRMFQLHDLRESKVWQEAHQEGRQEGLEFRTREFVKRLQAKGKSLKEIAELLDIPIADVR